MQDHTYGQAYADHQAELRVAARLPRSSDGARADRRVEQHRRRVWPLPRPVRRTVHAVSGLVAARSHG